MIDKSWMPPSNGVFPGSAKEFAEESYRRLIKTPFHWNLTWPDAKRLLPDETVAIEIYDPTHSPNIYSTSVYEAAPCKIVPILRPDGHCNIEFILYFGAWEAVRKPIEYLIDALHRDGWLIFLGNAETSTNKESRHYSMNKTKRKEIVDKYLEQSQAGKVSTQATFASQYGISERTLRTWIAEFYPKG